MEHFIMSCYKEKNKNTKILTISVTAYNVEIL